MNIANIARFEDAGRYFLCPYCSEELHLVERSLTCPNRHTFDIARQGYVNLAPQAKQSAFYNRESFESRHEILAKGYYAHVLQAVRELLGEPKSVLDVGCGEGFYTRALEQSCAGADMLAFDISKESVQLAARADDSKRVKWFVANLAKLPVKDSSIERILDIFSPASAQEFARVLAPEGTVVKVIPGAHHDEQLRRAARAQLRTESYSNEDVLAVLSRHFEILERRTVSQTFEMPYEDVLTFAHMTPLLFNVEIDKLDLTGVRELTIEAEVVLARAR